MSAAIADIPAAKARLDQMLEQRENLDVEIRKLSSEIANSESKFKVGDVITWKAGKSRRKGRIFKVVPWGGIGRQYFLAGIRADGSEGVQVNIYDWASNDIQLAESPP